MLGLVAARPEQQEAACAKAKAKAIAAGDPSYRVVKPGQTISGGLCTWTGAKVFCAFRSYLSTTGERGINALDAATGLRNGHVWLPGTSGRVPFRSG